jgi:hypothetical protein
MNKYSFFFIFVDNVDNVDNNGSLYCNVYGVNNVYNLNFAFLTAIKYIWEKWKDNIALI